MRKYYRYFGRPPSQDCAALLRCQHETSSASISSMKVLVIGGSGYMGKALVEQLLAAGDTVLILNRGRTPDTFGDRVQRLKADRDDRHGFRAALEAAGEVDAAIDFTAYEAQHVSDVVLVLAGKVGHYVFISTNSVCERKSCCPADLTHAASWR